ncbi:MAG: hypothetical protein FJ312_01650 [SAR202 cluster bacterium]|nr:hypothetical protein [SAR202 cluster bacterium]
MASINHRPGFVGFALVVVLALLSLSAAAQRLDDRGPEATATSTLENLAGMPKGSLIAFTSQRDGVPKIYLATADGSLTSLLVNERSVNPAWSPDGSKIAFTCRMLPPFNSDVCMVNVDGSGLTYLTDSPFREENPVWSPSGDTILRHQMASL